MRFHYVLLLVSGLVACRQQATPPPLSPEHQRALASLRVMDGFRVELVAAEPLVADPVAMEIDEQGRLFVVEMPGYPLDLSRSGRIKLLKDTNADGYPDQSVVWADSLTLPTGLMRWKNGLIVTDAPDVLYLEDTDGDDRADRRRVLLTGFARSNPQHNLNAPQFGLDNWIYLAHEGAITPFVYKKEFGDEGAAIRFPDNPAGTTLPPNADGRNVRFRPDTYALEALSGETQYGQTFDAWGHHLLTSNAHHLFHEVLAARYIRQNPNLLVPDATQNIPDHGDAAEVYPITENPSHQLLTDRGVMTSACGITWYGGGAFGERFRNVTFVAEPSHNLVHADVLADAGATFVARRLLEGEEFLASTDSWFRPVNFYVGPDGALYVVDYYRQSIEHPEWMSDEMATSGMLYNGKDKGRIYRIVPEDGLPMNWLGTLALGKQRSADLVADLENPNSWYRRTAQRLLYQRSAKDVVPALRSLIAKTARPEAAVHALWLLDAFGAADLESIRRCLHSKTAGVRENAIRVAERLNRPALTTELLALQRDPSAKVRFQLLCSLGFIKDPRADAARVAILKRDIDDRWVGLAALTGATGREMALYALAEQAFGRELSAAKTEFFAYLGATIANRGNVVDVQRLLAGPDDRFRWGAAHLAALAGMAKLWAHKGVTVPLTDADRLALVPRFDQPGRYAGPAAAHWQTQLDLLRVTGLPAGNVVKQQAAQAARLAADTGQHVATRTAAVQLLALYNPAAYANLLEKLAVRPGHEGVRLAAFASMSRALGGRACRVALAAWPQLTPGLKRQAVAAFMEQPDQIPALLAAIDQRQVPRSDLDWHQVVGLMNYYDAGIRRYARRVLAGSEDRNVVVQQYQPALTQPGNRARGKAVFARVCSSCHLMGGGGNAFGPDLATLRNRNPGNLLTEILHPNNSIADGYDLYTATLRSGRQVSGVKARETATTFTLRTADGTETVIARPDVVRLEKATTSAMPVGLESSISVAQMADLLAYLRSN